MTAEKMVERIVGKRKFLELKSAGIDFLYADQARFLLLAADCREQDFESHEKVQTIREQLKYD